MYKTALFIACVLILSAPEGIYGQSSTGDRDLNLGTLIQPITKENIFRDPDYYNWGSSIIKGSEGKYHLFYSRWPRGLGFSVWLTHSEIAHAVAESPEGPYQYVETVLEGRGGDHWDAITAHNPKIKYFEGKYYLYYIGTHSGNHTVSEQKLKEIGGTGSSHPMWDVLRNNQRTGVAVSESLHGPWTRTEKPIVEPSGPITTITVNPAVTQDSDGTYYMIVKGDKPNEERFIRNQAVAIASNPAGPFEVQEKPVIDYLDTEDASVWYDENREQFYGVF
ncbi:MAG TPA: glycoside hydrolase family protein, partial [Fodinibius sp.]|nr:glycoside hydrolase family protein [Fodinibius sp.]